MQFNLYLFDKQFNSYCTLVVLQNHVNLLFKFGRKFLNYLYFEKLRFVEILPTTAGNPCHSSSTHCIKKED